jgi:hypothetical protein
MMGVRFDAFKRELALDLDDPKQAKDGAGSEFQKLVDMARQLDGEETRLGTFQWLQQPNIPPALVFGVFASLFTSRDILFVPEENLKSLQVKPLDTWPLIPAVTNGLSRWDVKSLGEILTSEELADEVAKNLVQLERGSRLS